MAVASHLLTQSIQHAWKRWVTSRHVPGPWPDKDGHDKVVRDVKKGDLQYMIDHHGQA